MVAQRRAATEPQDDRPVFSIVAPVYNEEETLPHFYARVVAVLEHVGEPFEIVFVNDGSRDGSYRVLCALHARDPRVHVVDFSRNFGHQVAISAGLDHGRGRAVVILDSDLQDPPEVIPQLIARWRSGAQVVYARRRRPGETRFKLLTAALFQQQRMLRRSRTAGDNGLYVRRS